MSRHTAEKVEKGHYRFAGLDIKRSGGSLDWDVLYNGRVVACADTLESAVNLIQDNEVSECTSQTK